MRELWSKIHRALTERRGLDDDLSEEMQAHLEYIIDENIARGTPPEEARATARRDFGNQLAVRERATDAWRFPRVETVLQDVRYALRSIRKVPGFSLLLILTLALGIGANTAIFSVVYSVLLRPLPYPSGERLVWLGESTGKATGISATWINYQHWKSENHTFEDMAGFMNADLTMTGRGEALLTHAGVVTSNFFQLTGARPMLGRLFTEADDSAGAPPAVLVTQEFWAKALGGDPAVITETLALNGKPYQIAGVLAPGLKFFSRPVDLYMPLALFAGGTVNRGEHRSMRLLGLLKPGITPAEGRSDLDAIMERLALEDPGPENDHRAFAQYLTEHSTGDVRQTLLLLMGAVALVLILACANVAALLLVRGTARAREIAIRAAIGAGRGRLARQLLTENLVLAALGGGLGLLMARACLRTLLAAAPAGIPRLAEAGLDVQVLGFCAAVTIVVGLLAGLAPVFTAGKVDLVVALKEGSPGAGGGRRGHSFRSGLVIAEVAITFILSFASGLLLRSLIAAQTSYPGFDPDHVLALELQLPPSSYKTDESSRQFYGRLIQDLRNEPGVESVGSAMAPPTAGGGDWWYSILGEPQPDRGDVPISFFNIADTAYFSAMRIPLLTGRVFAEADRDGGPRVALINEAFARTWWAAPQLAVGRQIKMGGPYMEGPTYEIVGVVGNVSQAGLDVAPRPEIYFAFSQRASTAMMVMLRTSDEPERLIPVVRERIAAIDRNVPIQSLRPLESWLDATLANRRFSTLLLLIFAALAMILAAVGIYGVLNYWVGVRQKEIAIRMALGAPRSAILSWAGGLAIRLSLFGMVLGVLGSWGAARWLRIMVFGVSPFDPGMILAPVVGVVGIAALAASVPLWRATRVDAAVKLNDA
jgi:predicted permease